MNAKKIDIMDFINDEFILEAAPVHVFDKQYMRRNEMKRVFIRIMSASAGFFVVFAFIFFAAINIYMPVYARTIPFLGSAFAFVQDKLDFAGVYSNYAFEIGDTAADNGISVTMSEVYCDGTNLYVSFVIESETAFSEMSSDDYLKGQLHYEGDAYIIDGANRIRIGKSLGVGVSGLEGQFSDEYTFVGVESFSFDSDASNFPSEFEIEMEIHSIGIIESHSMDIKTVNGNWIFLTPIKSNVDDVVTYEINKEVNGHAIDKVVVTPVMITVYTSYPDLYSGTTRYQVKVYGDSMSDKNISIKGRYGETSGIDQIPRNRVDNRLYIYVIDYEQLCESGKKSGKREDIEEHAIVWAEVYIE